MNLSLKFPTTFVFGIFATFSAATASDHGLDDLSWLTGHWVDTRDPEKPIEVRWNAASSDAMVGTWRKNDGKGLALYEILTMREIDGAIYYRFDFYGKEKGEDTFSQSSSTRLKLLEVRNNHAVFQIVGEENWRLTMNVEDGVLSGWMEDTDKPDAEKFYSYVAKRQ